MSESLREPQLEPSEHCYTVLQDHGPRHGGWGPVAIAMPPALLTPTPFVYTGSSDEVLELVASVCRRVAQVTGKPTRLVRYSQREDVAVFGGSN